MKRAIRISLILILILAACSAQALVFTEADTEDMQSKADAPLLVVHPYVQNVTQNAVTLMWQTNTPTEAHLSIVANGKTWKYTTKPRCLSEVRLTGFAPDTQYHYMVTLKGMPAIQGSFKTFPKLARQVKFVAYGDSRSRPERHKMVIDAMAKEKDIDFVLTDGDLVTSGWPDEFAEEFFTPARKMVGHVPFFPAVGNHENNSPFYFRYFSLPMAERWYSLDLPDVHVIALDSCTDFGPGSKQHQWLIADLIGHKDVKWKFVILHHPIYSSGYHAANGGDGKPKEEAVRVAQDILPKLAKDYGITAFISGHDHRYERSTVDGVNYIVTGGGGAPGCKDRDADIKRNSRGGVLCVVLHYCLFTIEGDKARMEAKTIDGKVIDSVDLSSKVRK